MVDPKAMDFRSIVERRIDELLAIRDNSENAQPSHQAFQGTVSLFASVYGPQSTQTKSLEELGRTNSVINYPMARMQAARGALESLKGDLATGLWESLRAKVAGAVIADFLSLAKTCLDENREQAKNVAAVLAAAAYEDTVRRMGEEFAGVVDRPKLEAVLLSLREKGVLVDAQFTIAQSYLKFRNDALHADWTNLQRESVASAIAFVEHLILKHFS